MSKLKSLCWRVYPGVARDPAAISDNSTDWIGMCDHGRCISVVGAPAAVHGQAYLLLARAQPHHSSPSRREIRPGRVRDLSRYPASLIKNRFVIMAALRDPKLKNRDCILPRGCQAQYHRLADRTRSASTFPAKNAGIMRVSATEPDREDAAAHGQRRGRCLHERSRQQRPAEAPRTPQRAPADLRGKRERGPHASGSS